jgi:hypothetical protein
MTSASYGAYGAGLSDAERAQLDRLLDSFEEAIEELQAFGVQNDEIVDRAASFMNSHPVCEDPRHRKLARLHQEIARRHAIQAERLEAFAEGRIR